MQASIAVHLSMARPKVVAALTRQSRSLESAEEAFQEACVRALVKWPDQGLPRDPTGWLLMTGRNAWIDRMRKDRRLVFDDRLEEHEGTPEDVELDLVEQLDMSELRDDVLRLMFMCCHPDLSLQDQLALALKTIAGFSVEKIARAFVVRPKAMEQRITRAKKKGVGDGRASGNAESAGAGRPPRRRLRHDLPAFQRGICRKRWRHSHS